MLIKINQTLSVETNGLSVGELTAYAAVWEQRIRDNEASVRQWVHNIDLAWSSYKSSMEQAAEARDLDQPDLARKFATNAASFSTLHDQAIANAKRLADEAQVYRHGVAVLLDVIASRL